MDYQIEPHELNKLLIILEKLNINPDIIRALCKVEDISCLNKVQYNFLLYILCLK